MKIDVQKTGTTKIITVTLSDYKNPGDRVEYKANKMESILREELDLKGYTLIETSPSSYICNYQANNVGVYTFDKSKPAKVEKIVTTTETETQTIKAAQPKKKKKSAAKK